MPFIKVENIVINSSYIAAVKLDNQTWSGETCVSILMATPNLSQSQSEANHQNYYHCEWLDFTGRKAKVLQEYFSNHKNVIDLLPQQE